MCLLVAQPAGTVFDNAFIKGVFDKNGDGIGVMYAENDTITTIKALPKTLEEFQQFVDTYISGKACTWHARMQTHGDIDMHNCHPYEVISDAEGYPLWLMHNGILHTGNDADKSKSDTWHYIQDFLRPMLLKNPEFFMTEAFSVIIGDHIGSSNKFALMDAKGNVALVNEDRGVIHNGAWLSNTYAWDTTGTKFGWTKAAKIPPIYGAAPHYQDNNGYASWQSTDAMDRQAARILFDDAEEDDGGHDYSDQKEWEDEFNEILFTNYYEVYHHITWGMMDAYFEAVGGYRAWELVGALYDDLITAEELVEHMMLGATTGVPISEHNALRLAA